MMVKVFGMICIIISTTVIGYYIDRVQVLRIQDLEGLRQIFHLFYAELNYSVTPLPIALKEIINKNNTRVNCIFYMLVQSIEQKTGESISSLWDMAIQKSLPYIYLEEEDIKMLAFFGQSLGYLDKELQKKNIEITLGYIENQIQKLQRVYEKNGRLYRSLGMLGGCFLCIILF